MLAAKSLGRPVKWTSSRSETFLSDYHGRAAKLSASSRSTGKGDSRDPDQLDRKHGRLTFSTPAR